MINLLQAEADKRPDSAEYPAYEFVDGSLRPVDVPLSMEYSLTLSINGAPYTVIACSGSELREMVMGHLISEGFVQSITDIKEMNFDEKNSLVDAILSHDDRIQDRLLNLRRISSCGKGGGEINKREGDTPAHLRIAAGTVISVMERFLDHSKLRKKTWGVHSAALSSTEGKIITFFDEIGRHNAIDKVLGYALLEDIDLRKNIILTTGRVSSEIVIKLINASAGTIISRASPTSMSYELANTHGVTMIGRVRSGYFCVFSGHENVITHG